MTKGGQSLTKPPWLRVRVGGGPGFGRMQSIIEGGSLHTVCSEALCPNKGRCWEKGRATIMILGNTCTRCCRFCNVSPGRPAGCDADEPGRVAGAVAKMGLNSVVITSVTRDDLPDGGAGIWAETIRAIRRSVRGIVIEVLIPDFQGKTTLLDVVLEARPDVLGHNLETVPSLYGRIRPQAVYGRSLEVIRHSHGRGFITKTGIMLGLGESESEVLAVMSDARAAGCDIFYVGQYLRPSKQHAEVCRYVDPGEFDGYTAKGLAMGFGVVVSAPLVRSSYHAEEQDAFLTQRGLSPQDL
ncbi:MAG: lipoyl synthase [Verrucomicrobia bacterium]|nr:lipoyl synthase [Verrucomicrobiota bacterium]